MADHLMPSLINLLSSLLQRVAKSNDLNRPLNNQKLSVFNGLIRPNISVQSYLERIFKYANCSLSCYVVAYVYLDRFVKKQPYLPINSFNVHRLLVTSVLTSIKFMDDMCLMDISSPLIWSRRSWQFALCMLEGVGDTNLDATSTNKDDENSRASFSQAGENDAEA
ncbi:cyclin-like protein [Tanacetum coccineum]